MDSHITTVTVTREIPAIRAKNFELILRDCGTTSISYNRMRTRTAGEVPTVACKCAFPSLAWRERLGGGVVGRGEQVGKSSAMERQGPQDDVVGGC